MSPSRSMPAEVVLLRQDGSLETPFLSELPLIAPRYRIDVVDSNGKADFHGYHDGPSVQRLISAGSYQGHTLFIEPFFPKLPQRRLI
jgi:hypothetical protein